MMETANTDNMMESKTLSITSDFPIANLYNPLSGSNLIRTEVPEISVKDLSHENSCSAVINTEPADNSLPDGQLVTTVKTELSENWTPGDSTAQSCLEKMGERNQTHGNPTPLLNQTTEFLPGGRAAGNKPFVCDACGKNFNSPSDLVKHKRIHTGEKPFVCELCDKRFAEKSNLIRHKRSHTGEKPFVCDFCDKAFSTSTHLIIHKRYHNNEKPFECDLCDKRFGHQFNLTRHKLSHSGEKPFACDLCDKRYSRSNYLTKHKRSHSNDKRYVVESETENNQDLTMG